MNRPSQRAASYPSAPGLFGFSAMTRKIAAGLVISSALAASGYGAREVWLDRQAQSYTGLVVASAARFKDAKPALTQERSLLSERYARALMAIESLQPVSDAIEILEGVSIEQYKAKADRLRQQGIERIALSESVFNALILAGSVDPKKDRALFLERAETAAELIQKAKEGGGALWPDSQKPGGFSAPLERLTQSAEALRESSLQKTAQLRARLAQVAADFGPERAAQAKASLLKTISDQTQALALADAQKTLSALRAGVIASAERAAANEGESLSSSDIDEIDQGLASDPDWGAARQGLAGAALSSAQGAVSVASEALDEESEMAAQMAQRARSGGPAYIDSLPFETLAMGLIWMDSSSDTLASRQRLLERSASLSGERRPVLNPISAWRGEDASPSRSSRSSSSKAAQAGALAAGFVATRAASNAAGLAANRAASGAAARAASSAANRAASAAASRAASAAASRAASAAASRAASAAASRAASAAASRAAATSASRSAATSSSSSRR